MCVCLFLLHIYTCVREMKVCESVPVLLLLSTLIRRWGDNCEGIIVKEIIGDSKPPDRSLSGLGFWPIAQVSIYSAGVRASQQTRLEMWREAARRRDNALAREREWDTGRERYVRSWGECSHTLDYPFNEAIRCHCFITLRKWEKNQDSAVGSLCFPLLGWHLFSLFAAVFLSSPLTGTNASVSPLQQQALPSVHPHLDFQDTHAFWLIFINLPLPLFQLM